jgi:DNA-binding SARP family transcriptional activator
VTEFRVLGPLEVRDGGEPLAITSRRQRVLLCRLLLDANRAVSSDALYEALWGEQPPPTAAKALQGQVVALRGLLGRERIATVPGGYRLDVEPDAIDVARLERAVGAARRDLTAGDATAAAATLRAALALARGRPFDDIADQLASGPEVARLEELLAGAREDRIEADLALARHHELIGELEALVQADPLRERLQGQLMLALYRAGRQTEALEVYQRARLALRDGVGLEPGPELRELQRAILEHDPRLAVEPPEVRARRHLPAPLTGLVGRGA